LIALECALEKPATGMKIKYGKSCDGTPWRKLHIGIDQVMNMQSVEVTDYASSDIGKLDDLINIEAPISKVISDGAYYSKKRVQKFYEKDITPVIPPPPNSIVHGLPETEWHDKIVQYIQEKETVYAFSFAVLRFIKNMGMA